MLSGVDIKFLDPQKILTESRGEIVEVEALDYREPLRVVEGGLYCEKIFGPLESFRCRCGKYRSPRFKGLICDVCGVEIISSEVRRRRIGHLEFAFPIAHLWFQDKIAEILDLNKQKVKDVIYYRAGLVKKMNLEAKEALLAKVTDSDLRILISELELEKIRKVAEIALIEDAQEEFDVYAFEFELGAVAFRPLLDRIDVEREAIRYRMLYEDCLSRDSKKAIVSKLRLFEWLRDSGQKPGWWVMDRIVVLPADLRPFFRLADGMIGVSEVTTLYRNIIAKNNQARDLKRRRGITPLIREQARMLQEEVDCLFENGKTKTSRSQNGKALKSLKDLISGKAGYLRANLLGKRVDFSGRSVIVVGPNLALDQVGLPEDIAWELYKPFLISRVLKQDPSLAIREARLRVEERTPAIREYLVEECKTRPVFLNRAPSLHRASFQSFFPILHAGRAIQLQPLVCAGFNADFDGDQMAVHLPLSEKSRLEAIDLMLPSKNILHPANGAALISPSQDMVLGCYFLSKEIKGSRDEGRVFVSVEELLETLKKDEVEIHALIHIANDERLSETSEKIVVTTPGRVFLSVELGYPIVRTMGKSELRKLVEKITRERGPEEAARVVTRIKDLGYEWSTKAGISINIEDMIIPNDKDEDVRKTLEQVKKLHKAWKERRISDRERYSRTIELYSELSERVTSKMFESMKNDNNGFNSLWMMMDSGSRGSGDQVRQLAAMRGLMAKPSGEIIETGITSNFREGLSPIEFFITTSGAHKGLADKALSTADAGYLTRKLVDVAQEIICTEEDCGTHRGIRVSNFYEGNMIYETLEDRILRRVSAEDVYDSDGNVIVEEGELIDVAKAKAINQSKISSILIRSPITCESIRGVCRKCYGHDLSRNEWVQIGTPIGVLAAHSISEPGTQLTLRSFHTGGVASIEKKSMSLRSHNDGVLKYDRCRFIQVEDKRVNVSYQATLLINYRDKTIEEHRIPYGSQVVVDESEIEKDTILATWEEFGISIYAELDGRATFKDLVEDVTFRKFRESRIVMEDVDKRLNPRIEIAGIEYCLPTNFELIIEDGQEVKVGDRIAYSAQSVDKNVDITSGIELVSKTLEAQRLQPAALLAREEGKVVSLVQSRGRRCVYVQGNDYNEYEVPLSSILKVRVGDQVRVGDEICEGHVNAQEVLEVFSETIAAQHVVNTLQKVYRSQGVRVDDRHFEVVVKRMIDRVEIYQSGDSDFLVGEEVSKTLLTEINKKITEMNGTPAMWRPRLMSIKRAALESDSWLSKASFMDTKRVLKASSIRGQIDLLNDIKPNVILGSSIPIGSNFRRVTE